MKIVSVNVSLIYYSLISLETKYPSQHVQGDSNMTGTDLYVNKPQCAAAVRP